MTEDFACVSGKSMWHPNWTCAGHLLHLSLWATFTVFAMGRSNVQKPLESQREVLEVCSAIRAADQGLLVMAPFLEWCQCGGFAA